MCATAVDLILLLDRYTYSVVQLKLFPFAFVQFMLISLHPTPPPSSCSLFIFDQKEIWQVKYSTKPVGKDDVFWYKQTNRKFTDWLAKWKEDTRKKKKTSLFYRSLLVRTKKKGKERASSSWKLVFLRLIKNGIKLTMFYNIYKNVNKWCRTLEYSRLT